MRTEMESDRTWAVVASFALPAMLTGLVMGEPARHREPAKPHGMAQAIVAYFSPLTEFLKREGALVVLLFVLIHKIGDTLANLTLRLLFQDQDRPPPRNVLRGAFQHTNLAPFDIEFCENGVDLVGPYISVQRQRRHLDAGIIF